LTGGELVLFAPAIGTAMSAATASSGSRRFTEIALLWFETGEKS
jgi:hypothetical protein